MKKINKIYVEVTEAIEDNTRAIKYIHYNDVVYTVNDSFPIGVENIQGYNYLTFLCKIGKHKVKLYCDNKNTNDIKYFTLK